MNTKQKNILSSLCLVIVVSSYCGYYFDSILFIETFSEAKEKIDLVNSLLSPPVQGKAVLQDFSSIKELISFLKADKTNEIVYSSPDFVCHHFTEELIRNARADGFRLEYFGIYGKVLKNYQNDYSSYLSASGFIGTWGDGEGHAVCIAHIENQSIIIEPQTDVIFRYEDGIFLGVFIGEY
jgi:hypothetical protein